MGQYDEKAKERITRYLKKNREEIRLNVPKGTKDKFKAFAESQGMSMTRMILKLVEDEMRFERFEYKGSEDAGE